MNRGLLFWCTYEFRYNIVGPRILMMPRALQNLGTALLNIRPNSFLELPIFACPFSCYMNNDNVDQI
jgi:hypothetical protein